MNPEHPAWRKSSYSNGTGGNNCVEVAAVLEGVTIRDSKFSDDNSYPQLHAGTGDWQTLIQNFEGQERLA